MAEMKDRQQSAKSSTATQEESKRFTAEERAAMKERAQELKAAKNKAGGTRRAREDRRDAQTRSRHGRAAPCAHRRQRASALAEDHYGMPAYTKDGKVVCFFRGRQKFKERYATFGFNDTANLDEGAMWPVAYALTELTAADEARIGALVKKAVS
jgi:hypothetical protein